MYRSVTAHEFDLLRPKEVPLLVVSQAAAGGAVLEEEEASKAALPYSSSAVDFSKIGEYQHENSNVNVINHQINNSIAAAIPPPPPPHHHYQHQHIMQWLQRRSPLSLMTQLIRH